MATISDILLEKARSAREGAQRRGDISAQMWANLGGIASQTGAAIGRELQERPMREAAAQAQADEARLRGLQIGNLERQAEGAEAAASREAAFRESMRRGSRAQVLESLKGDPELYQRAADHFTRIDSSYKRYLGDVAAGVRAFGDTPEAAMIAIDDLIANGHDERQLDQFRGQIQQGGQAAVSQFVDALLANSPDEAHRKMVVPKKEPGTRLITERKEDGTEVQRIVPDVPGQVAVSAPEVKPDTRSLQLQLNDALMRGDKEAINRIRRVMRESADLERAPVQPSFQAKEVLGDDGKSVMANFDARTGRYTDQSGKPIANPRPVPSAMETQDARKFKQADPILRSVTELSERINTQEGVIAKMSGGIERQKARVNLNDDIAEYEALVSGFTPLVARALGHTGVLTQQDVDSVKALFPRPGDSKSLRDRKIARIKSIIGELQQDEQPAPDATGKVNPSGSDGPPDLVYDPVTKSFRKPGG